MKGFKEVAFATVMCGAMVMASCSKREVLPIGEKPDVVTKKEVSTTYSGPAIYVETADGVVHNTGLRATARETREWTSPDGTVRVSGLGEYRLRDIETHGIIVPIHVKEGYELLGWTYRFEGEHPVTDEEQKERDRVWEDSGQPGKGVLGDATDFAVFHLPSGSIQDGYPIPENTHRILIRCHTQKQNWEWKVDVYFTQEYHLDRISYSTDDRKCKIGDVQASFAMRPSWAPPTSSKWKNIYTDTYGRYPTFSGRFEKVGKQPIPFTIKGDPSRSWVTLGKFFRPYSFPIPGDEREAEDLKYMVEKNRFPISTLVLPPHCSIGVVYVVVRVNDGPEGISDNYLYSSDGYFESETPLRRMGIRY